MLKHALVLGASIVGISLVACSGDDAGASISAEAACDDAAKAICAKLNECAPFFVTLAWGSVATCEQRAKIDCVPKLNANGTSQTPSQLSQCATDAKSMTCEDALGRNSPVSCHTQPGTLADGAACGTDAQCKGRLCRLSAGSVCGACSTIGAAGAACERDEDCDNGLACADKKCVTLGKAGAPCSATQPCTRSLSCNKGTCATPIAAGGTCEPNTDQSQNPCDAAKGFYCHFQTKVCTEVASAAAGGQCGLVNNNIALCTGGSDCKVSMGLAGTCQATAADGATCDDTKGPKCAAPARCASGVCKISDPSACK